MLNLNHYNFRKYLQKLILMQKLSENKMIQTTQKLEVPEFDSQWEDVETESTIEEYEPDVIDEVFWSFYCSKTFATSGIVKSKLEVFVFYCSFFQLNKIIFKGLGIAILRKK